MKIGHAPPVPEGGGCFDLFLISLSVIVSVIVLFFA